MVEHNRLNNKLVFHNLISKSTLQTFMMICIIICIPVILCLILALQSMRKPLLPTSEFLGLFFGLIAILFGLVVGVYKTWELMGVMAHRTDELQDYTDNHNLLCLMTRDVMLVPGLHFKELYVWLQDDGIMFSNTNNFGERGTIYIASVRYQDVKFTQGRKALNNRRLDSMLWIGSDVVVFKGLSDDDKLEIVTILKEQGCYID